MPVGAFGGRQDMMDMLAPLGPVYQAGTLSGNPVAMAAGIATLSELSAPGFYEALTATTERFVNGNDASGAGSRSRDARCESRRDVWVIFCRASSHIIC